MVEQNITADAYDFIQWDGTNFSSVVSFLGKGWHVGRNRKNEIICEFFKIKNYVIPLNSLIMREKISKFEEDVLIIEPSVYEALLKATYPAIAANYNDLKIKQNI